MRMLFAAVAAAMISTAAQAQAPERVVFFALGSDRISAAGMAELDAAAADYAATGAASVSIVGHTDTTGSAAYNEDLSRRRAKNVADALAARGVPADQMLTAWRGETELAVPTGDNAKEPRNRRAEIAFGEPDAPMAEAPAEVARVLAGVKIGIGPYVAYNMQEDDESWFVGGNLTASYFVTENIALSAEQAVFYNLDAKDEGWGGRSLVGADYHFGGFGVGTDPFVGVNAGYMYIDGSGTGGFFGGPEIGASFGPVTARLAYDFVEDRDADEGVISLSLSYDFRF
jgi:hypothetical protein